MPPNPTDRPRPGQVYGSRMPEFRILDHTADAGIEAESDDLAGLIGALATGMFELMAEEIPPSPLPGELRIQVSADGPEDLVYEALSELLYVSEVEDVVLRDIEVEVPAPGSASISAHGVPTARIEATGAPIKAITYHGFEVRPTDGGWRGRIFFDV